VAVKVVYESKVQGERVWQVTRSGFGAGISVMTPLGGPESLTPAAARELAVVLFGIADLVEGVR